jgi:hypothetical protein
VWAVIFSDGALKLSDLEQIKEEKWVPLAAIRPKDDPDAPARILFFPDGMVAYKFVKRNERFKSWLRGGLQLGDDDAKMIEEKFPIEKLSYPNRYDSHPTYQLCYEVVELSSLQLNYVRG